MAKITLATVKKFIRENKSQLLLQVATKFDGMTDGVEPTGDSSFRPVVWQENDLHTLGVKGAWFVGGSRDYFSEFNNASHKGIEIYNSCGSFTIAIKKVTLAA